MKNLKQDFPAIYLTREVFVNLLNEYVSSYKKKDKFLKNVNKFFDIKDRGLSGFPESYSLNLIKKSMKDYDDNNEYYDSMIEQIVLSVIDGIPYELTNEKDETKVINQFDDVYDLLMVDYNIPEITSEFVYELSLYQRDYEKTGNINAQFDRILNTKEIALVNLLGFNHQTNWLPIESDDLEAPFDFEDEKNYISSIHKSKD